MKGRDENWMWERYDFPHNVRVWIKVNEKGGGTMSNLIILMKNTMILGMRVWNVFYESS